MRISDWSSDVCSSDLATSGNGTLTQNRHQGKTNFDAHAKSCLARPARGETIPNQAIETQRKRRRPHGRRLSLFYNCQGQLFGRINPRCARRGARRCERACRRSEEHTSELQSLMRISYAVFCLKKKTQKK